MRKAIFRTIKCDYFLFATKKISRLPSSTFPKKNRELKNDPGTCRLAKADSLLDRERKVLSSPSILDFRST